MSQIAKVRQCGVRVANVSQRNVARKVKIEIIYLVWNQDLLSEKFNLNSELQKSFEKWPKDRETMSNDLMMLIMKMSIGLGPSC